MLNQRRSRRSPGLCGALFALLVSSHAGTAQGTEVDKSATATEDDADEEETSAEDQKAKEEAPSPLSLKNGGPWWLVGDGNLSTVNFRDPDVSFSVGLHLWTDQVDFTVLLRKGTAGTIDGVGDRRNLSEFVLNPSKTDLGGSVYASLYPWQVKRLITDNSDFRLGPTLRFDIGSANWRYTTGAGAERTDPVNGFRLTLGFSAQSRGKVGDNQVAILGHIGPTLRFVGGDIATTKIGNTNNTYYGDAMGTDRKHAWGGEFGFGIRVNGLEIYAEVPFLWMKDGEPVSGLTGGQFVQTVTLRAPIAL